MDETTIAPQAIAEAPKTPTQTEANTPTKNGHIRNGHVQLRLSLPHRTARRLLDMTPQDRDKTVTLALECLSVGIDASQIVATYRVLKRLDLFLQQALQLGLAGKEDATVVIKRLRKLFGL